MDARDYYCTATTLKGKKCPYKASVLHPVSKKPICGIHYKQHLKTLPSAPAEVDTSKKNLDPQPWRALKLPDPSPSLRTNVRKRLVRRLNRGPRKATDSAGYMYAFYLTSETGKDYWKVGMTTRAPEDRLKEWQSSLPHHNVQLKKAFYVPGPCVEFVERVVHLYLDHCRLHRYPVLEGRWLISKFSATGAVVKDEHWTAVQNEAQERVVARRKQVEWFCAPWPAVHDLIVQVIRVFGSKET